MIASLFGQALDTRAEVELSNAGRLRIETDPFEDAQAQPIFVNGDPTSVQSGPANVQRQLTVRNPLDRVSHASRDGGLHHFLEFRRGASFGLRLTVLNPSGYDIGLVTLWRRELEAGMLRLGALCSIGRGRVSITSARYQVWRSRQAPAAPWTNGLKSTMTPDSEPLGGLFDAFEIPPEALSQFSAYVNPA